MNQEREHGFTFVEIISVLVIMGILGAVALPDFFSIQDRIRRRMTDNVIRDLNHREYLIWLTYSESSQDHDDGVIFNQVNRKILVPSSPGRTAPTNQVSVPSLSDPLM